MKETTPLESNKFIGERKKAIDAGKDSFVVNGETFKVTGSAAKMISTGIAGVDPMTGMPQANQFAPSPINPNALGSMQPQIPSIAGTPQAGSYNNVMPQAAQAGLAAPLNIGKPVEKKSKVPENATFEVKFSKPLRDLYKDVDGVVRDKDGKDAGYPIK